MRFERGTQYPPRGPARKQYRMSDEALRARRRNFTKIKRLRSNRESLTVKLLIWQAFFGEEPKQSQRALARELGVWPSYVCKVQKQATSAGWDPRVQYGRRVTLDDLADARRFTEKLRQTGPDLLAPAPQPRASGETRAMTADEQIAENWRIAREEQRKNPCYCRRHGGWFRW
jgi:hypothetical protein